MFEEPCEGCPISSNSCLYLLRSHLFLRAQRSDPLTRCDEDDSETGRQYRLVWLLLSMTGRLETETSWGTRRCHEPAEED